MCVRVGSRCVSRTQGAGHEAAVVTRAEAIARQLGAGDALEAVVEAVIAQQPAADAREAAPPPAQSGASARSVRKLGNGRSAAEAAEAAPPPPPV